MNRSVVALRWMAPVLLLLLIAAAVAVLSPADVSAQAGADSSISVEVSAVDPTQPFRTVAVGFDPGAVGVAALSATLHFDAALIDAYSCEVAEAGACNVTDDGRVLVSVFNLNGLRANEQLLTVNFEPTPTAAGTTRFEVVVDTAVNFQGMALDPIAAVSVDVVLTTLEFGSLTGDVIDEEFATALYGLDICVTHDLSQAELCTTTTGLGTWRIDDLLVGSYAVVVSDPAGVYAPTATIGTVSVDQVTAGVDSIMVLATETDSEPEADPDADSESPSTAPIFTGPPTEYTVVVYEASIAGRVTAIDTAKPLQALQVCATQPLVLHQSCATTDGDGVFALDGISTGNYWITVVDPLGQFEEAHPKLVGVVGDDVVRSGVQIRLVPTAG